VETQELERIVSSVVKELGQRGAIGSAPANASPAPSSQASSFVPGPRKGMSVAVLGAGHGGLAMAGHIAQRGFSCNLFSYFDFELASVRERGGVELEGEVKGFYKLNKITNSMDEAIKGVDLIMLQSPAVGHRPFASIVTNLLRDGQVVVLNPGRCGGALEVARTMRRFALKADVALAEAQTNIYAAEMRGPGKVEILHEKNHMRVAALPAVDNKRVLDSLNQVYPQITAGQNVLETSFNNIGGVVHPGPMLLGTHILERVKAGEDLRYYKHMVTQPICEMVCERIDHEKVSIAQSFGLDAWTTLRWYNESYGVNQPTLYQALQNNPYYLGFHAPSHLMAYNHMLDEIPNSLVPLSSFGDFLGIETPAIDSIIQLGSSMTNINFWKEGRTVESLGLGGMSKQEILDYVERAPLVQRCPEWTTCGCEVCY
jgi:opine dehydrogenase